MGKRVPYISEDRSTGRLFYRRVFPSDLKAFLSEPRAAHKAPLGVRSTLNALAMRCWEQADREYEAALRSARAAKALHDKISSGNYDRLDASLLSYLSDTFIRDWHLRDEAALQSGDPDLSDRMAEGWRWLGSDFQQWRAEDDLEAMEEHWGKQADALLRAEGVRLDPEDHEGRDRLLRALNDAALKIAKPSKKRLKGKLVDIPQPPIRPAREGESRPAGPSSTFKEIVEKLLESGTAPVSATTKESVRTALRFFEEACGTPKPAEITRAMVTDWLSLLAKRPSALPKEHRAVPLPELVALYEGKTDVRRLSQKTLRQHVSALGAKWNDGTQAGWISDEQRNPFGNPHLEKTKVRKAPKGFSTEELQAILNLPIFTEGERPGGGKGGASYWLPLILLFTGARPEEIAQLLVADLFQDQKSKRWMLRISDEGQHPYKGQQRLKNTDSPRTFPIPRPLIDLGLLRYRKGLKDAGELALFPLLRPKGARGDLYPQFGQWWSQYLVDHNAKPKGEGRQPMRELRHTWSTAARRSKLTREAMSFIQGHRLSDGNAGEGYGELDARGLAIDDIAFQELDVNRVRAWEG